MKKIFITLFLTGILFSCSTSGTDEKATKKQIAEYKKELTEINNKIAELELQLTGQENIHMAKTAVKVAEVKKAPFAHYFEATGELESVSEAFISPETGGQITVLNVVEGQKVKKGQLLAKLNTSVIEQQISEVKTRLDLAEIIYNKQSELWEKKIGSERQFLEAKNNYESLQSSLKSLQAQYNMSILRSPIDGYVEQIAQKKGEMAAPGMQLMQIINLDNLYVTTKLSEAYLSSIQVGDVVGIRFPSFPGLVLHKPVYRIGNVINKQSRTFDVQVKIENNDGLLKPNLLANILINDYDSEASIVVPTIIIKEDMKGNYLFVVEQNSEEWKVTKKYVETGITYASKTEVLSGLNEGEQIITAGYSNVSDGMLVNIN